MFSGSPLLRMAANGVLDTLMDPASAPAIALAKEHLAKISGIRALEQKGSQSLYFLYSEYALRDPKTGASEKFSQSGTAFVISADGKLATAKRVVEPWKYDLQTILMISRDHLEVDPKSIRLAAWPAGATILAGDGTPDLASALSTEKQTLRVLRTSPDRLEKQDYQDPDSGEKTTLEVHAGGESDLAVLQFQGSNLQPLELAVGGNPGADSKLTLLGFPFGLSQSQVTPKPVAVTTAGEEGAITLDLSLNPGQSGAPLVTTEGKVVAICAEPSRCVPVEILRQLIP
jgi:S1-C subfamily serine protease